MSFSIGDRIKCVNVDGYSGLGTVVSLNDNGSVRTIIRDNSTDKVYRCWSTMTKSYHPGITKITNMNIKEQFLLAFKSEPFKSFRKKGITNGDDFLTSEGTQVFLGWLLSRNADDFKKEVVDSIEVDDNK